MLGESFSSDSPQREVEYLSVRQAHELLEREDMPLGSVTTNFYLDGHDFDHPIISQLGHIHEESMIELVDSGIFEAEVLTEEQIEVENTVHVMESTYKLLGKVSATPDESLSDQELYVKSVLKDYEGVRGERLEIARLMTNREWRLREKGDRLENASLNDERIIYNPLPVDEIRGFIDFYRERISGLYERVDFQEIIQETRSSMAELTDSPRVKHVLGPAVKRMRRPVEDTPITISDPLAISIENINLESQILGSYWPEDNVVQIDPFSIGLFRTEVETDGSELRFNTGVLQDTDFVRRKLTHVVMHELVHAATNGSYLMQRYAEDGEEVMQPHQSLTVTSNAQEHLYYREYFPAFFREGMTEKITAVFAAIHFQDNLGLPLQELSRENKLRSAYYDDPDEVLAPKYLQKLRPEGEVYLDYRVLIDELFDQADWDRAGTTKQQAVKQAVDAFICQDEDDSRFRNRPRKEFMKVLHAATQSAVLFRLEELIMLQDDKRVLDMIESPDFDITSDPIPYIASSKKRSHISSRARRYESHENQLRQFEFLGASESVIEQARRRTEKSRQYKEELGLLKLADIGLEHYLETRFGRRERNRKLALFWGRLPSNSQTHHVDQIDESKLADLRSWVESHPHDSTDFLD